jgi:5'-AMP-activated protein kinase catalytic alpha subunit
MISGKPYVGLSSDIWSAGVVLFCILTGKLPFDDENLKQLYKKITKGKYLIPSSLSPLAKDLMQSILNVDPEKRFNIEQILSHPWCNLTKPKLDCGIIIGIDKITLDEEIVKIIFGEVEKFKGYRTNRNMTYEDLRTSLNENHHNCLTTR